MANKQTRRSISVSKETYDRLRAHVAALNEQSTDRTSGSAYTEAALNEAMDNDVKLGAAKVAAS